MTSPNPRDPGKISQAFPSRARAAMQRLASFDKQVHDLAAEAPGGRTSAPSPSPSSAASRRRLTGVTEHPEQQGWTQGHALPHLCLPPQRYPEGCGPGSRWLCRCDAVWEAHGIAWDEYPVGVTRREAQFNVEMWKYVDGGQLAEGAYRGQEGLYDWRPLGPYYVRLYRAMIENQLGGATTWQELG